MYITTNKHSLLSIKANAIAQNAASTKQAVALDINSFSPEYVFFTLCIAQSLSLDALKQDQAVSIYIS